MAMASRRPKPVNGSCPAGEPTGTFCALSGTVGAGADCSATGTGVACGVPVAVG